MTSFQYSSKLFFLKIVTYFVLSKQIWLLCDQLFFKSFHMKVCKSLSASLFSIGGQLLTFIRKFYEGKQWILVVGYSYLFCQYETSHLSQEKTIASFKIERMSLNLLVIWPKHKIEMQIIYDARKAQVWEFVFQGQNIATWSTGKHYDGDANIKKTWKPLWFKKVALFLSVLWRFDPAAYSRTLLQEWYQASPALDASQSETRLREFWDFCDVIAGSTTRESPANAIWIR